MQKVLYIFPENKVTRKGRFETENIYFKEWIRDSEIDAVQEIDFDFRFQENILIPVYEDRKESDIFITINLN